MNKHKLIYIAGTGRSGSTLLANILGEADHSICVGETIFFWPNFLANKACSCGESFADCGVWGYVLKKILRDIKSVDVRLSNELKLVYIHQILAILVGRKNFIQKKYLEIFKKMFIAIYEISGAQVVVDESKYLPYLFALTQIEILDIFVVHIVRDPRAVAFSWQRVKRQHVGFMPRYSWYVTARRWLAEQFFFLITNCFVSPEKFIRIRYEDFVANPKNTVVKIYEKMGLRGESPFMSDAKFSIHHNNHLVASNPSSPKFGINTIQKDMEWQEKMPSRVKAAITFICWPMMLVYGYPISSDVAKTRGKAERPGSLE